jgi:hypothetical protein
MDAASADRATPAIEPDRRFRLRGAPIIHDTIDNETIAINQLSGAYYSLDGASALVWQRLAEGASAAQIAGELTADYPAPAEALRAKVADFLAELLAEELIVPADQGSAAQEAPARPSRPTTTPAGLPELRLQRYNDLEVLLLADPIHEVDETGWPKPLADRE